MNDRKLEVIVKERRYNGKLNIGSILKTLCYFKVNGKEAETHSEIVFNSYNNKKYKFATGSPYLFEEDILKQIDSVTKVIEVIENNPDYKYNESHYAKKTFGFDKNFYNYTDVIINDQEYEIPKNDEIIIKLKKAMGCFEITEEVFEIYRQILPQMKKIRDIRNK